MVLRARSESPHSILVEMARALLEKVEPMESAEQVTHMVEAIGDRLLIVDPIEVARPRWEKMSWGR